MKILRKSSAQVLIKQIRKKSHAVDISWSMVHCTMPCQLAKKRMGVLYSGIPLQDTDIIFASSSVLNTPHNPIKSLQASITYNAMLMRHWWANKIHSNKHFL